MTTNAFIFSWDIYGVESIIEITQYENWDAEQCWRILSDEPTQANPLRQIMNQLLLRARFNSHRHYEIYAIDCDESITKKYWEEMWEENPQGCADLLRKRGTKLHSDRLESDKHRQLIV